MAKTKISEFSATANSNTDINSINIAEGCAPSNINDAIRELMAELKDFQAGTKGDSFNGPVGTTTAAAGAFTTLSSTGNTTLGDASGDTVTINGTATFANVNPTLSAGTANGVLYLNGSKVATSGTALTFDGTNFATTGTASATKLIPTGGTATGNGMYLPAANTLAWSTNGTEGMRLDLSQNLGLGVTPSAWGTTNSVKGFQLPGVSLWGYANTNAYLNANSYYNGSNRIYVTSSYATEYAQTAGQHQWYTAPSGTAGNAITFTQAMTLDASGNLGVGTTSPTNTAGYQTIEANGSSGGIIRATYGTSVKGYFFANSAGVAIGTETNDSLVFRTNATEKARIDSSGNFNLGTTTMTRNFNIGGSNAAVGMNMNNTGTSGRSYSIFSTNSSASAVGALGFYDDTAGAYRMVIDSSGNLLVGATTSSGTPRLYVKGSSTSATDLGFFFVNSAGSTLLAAYNNGALYADNMKSGAGTNAVKFSTSTGQITYDTSSARYKDNIRDSIYGLSHVMQMRSTQFEYKDDKRSDVGLIAEELYPIIPELVGKNKDGEPDSVSYDRMVSVLVKAIQEQQAIIQTLTARIEALESKGV